MSAFDPSVDVDPDGFRDFAGVLGEHVGLDLTAATPGSLLREELGFDSLAMAETLVLLADHGVLLPDDLIPALRTIGDLHHYAALGAHGPEALEPAR